jgi:L-ascorbate metabolism protein UlaG (beta-lactamase superfamily)
MKSKILITRALVVAGGLLLIMGAAMLMRRVALNQKGVWITKYPGNFTCFKIETAEGLTIITDPYGMDETVHADIVAVSHSHWDHTDFSRIEGPSLLIINTTETYTIQGVKITGVRGHHNKGEPLVNVIYVFDLDGIRLAQFASQGEVPTDTMFATIGKVDILIIQIYGKEKGKLTVGEASQIAQRLQAKIVIPAHTDTSQNDTLAALLMGGESEKITTGKLLVSRANLAAQTAPRVVVLDVPDY